MAIKGREDMTRMRRRGHEKGESRQPSGQKGEPRDRQGNKGWPRQDGIVKAGGESQGTQMARCPFASGLDGNRPMIRG